jgi:hypothetical protein
MQPIVGGVSSQTWTRFLRACGRQAFQSPDKLTIYMASPKLRSPQLLECMMETETTSPAKVPWSKGKLVGQQAPMKLKAI